MPKESSQGHIRPRPIASNCKYKYSDFVDPVYETDKVPKEEMERLSCRATHCVRLKLQTMQKMTICTIYLLYTQGKTVNL